jgi:DNA-binding MarR family transcriptional regulator
MGKNRIKDANEQLIRLGFSQYEAQAYISLLQRNPLSGYELAKVSAIPRPNIYPVLRKLEDRGAVVRMDTPEGVRYAPVAARELFQRVRSQFDGAMKAVESSLCEIGSRADVENVWNLHSYPSMLDHARTLIGSARSQLLLAIWPQEAEGLVGEVDQAQARGVSTTTLCLANCAHECGFCRGRVHRYPVASQPDARWLMLVPDCTELLAGEVKTAGQTLAVRTRQALLVGLATWYIRHTIALSVLLQEAGEVLESTLSPAAKTILASLNPTGMPDGWFKHIRWIIGTEGQ